MPHFELKNPFPMEPLPRKRRLRLVILEGIVPTMIQFGVLVLAILEFAFLIGSGNGAPLIQTPRLVGGELSNPNAVRFAYLFLALSLSLALAVLAERRACRGSDSGAFWYGIIGGLLLWQAIGECSWHFGFSTAGSFTGFPRIECAAGAFLLLPFLLLLVYAARRHAFGWGVWCFLLSFLCNWLGHFVMIGTFPLVSSFLEEAAWYRVCGLCIGIPLSLLSLALMFFVAQNKKARLLSSLLLYTAIGILATGLSGM